MSLYEKKYCYHVHNDAYSILNQVSKNALIDIVWEALIQLHGKQKAVRYREKVVSELIAPVLKLRHDKVPYECRMSLPMELW